MNSKSLKNNNSKLKNGDVKDLDSGFVEQLNGEIKEAENKNDQIQERIDKEIVEIVQDVDKAMIKLIKNSE